jgi:Putative Ig domain
MLQLFSLLRRSSRRATSAARSRSPRLELETLEDRCLLATFLVTTNAASGAGSLANAVAQAATGDSITFSPALAGQPITLASPLTIANGITIAGTGSDSTIINGAQMGRLFDVTSSSPVVIAGVTITNGLTTTPNTSGGAILNSGNLVLESDSLTGNQVLGAGSEGGAIANTGAGAVLTISDSTISGNFASGGGGVLFNDSMASATITMSSLMGNRAAANGSGIDNLGKLNLSIDAVGLEIATTGGNLGGAINNRLGADLIVTASSFVGNAAIEGGGGLNNDGTATIIDTTMVVNNVLSTTGPGGGAIRNTGTLLVFNSTITANGDASSSPTSSGNISTTGGTVLLDNTIVAEGNSADGVAPDINGSVSPTSSNNFIGAADANLVGITNGVNANQVGTVANPIKDLIGIPQNNGGPTPNRVPLPGSPVIDKGNNALIPPGVTLDQRGFNRIINGTVDIGAVEFQPPQTVTTLTFTAPGTLNVTVTGVAPGSSPPSGQVSFFSGGTLSGGILMGGTLVGTATLDATGKANFTVTASSGNSFTAVYNGNLSVGELGSTSNQVSTPPTFTSAATTTFTTTEPGSFSVTFAGTPPVTVAESGTLPAGVTFNPATDVLGGTPAVGTDGSYSITFIGSNTIGSTSQAFTLTINSPISELGAYRPSDGSWSLDSDGTLGFNPATDQVFFSFSPPGVTGVAGDWNGNGIGDIGDFSNGVWHLDLAGTGAPPGANETFQFGQAGDIPVVGDWDGNPDGQDELGVFRAAPNGIAGEFILDIANHRTMDSSNETITFGLATDHPIVGDWTGAGTTEVGVYRDAATFNPADAGDIVFSLDAGNAHTFNSSSQVFVFGLITDHVVIGDWTGNGVSKVGVYRDGAAFNAPGTALFTLDSGAREYIPGVSQVLLYGLDSDQFVSGHWAKTPPVQPEGTPQAQFAANGQGPGGVPALTEAQLQPVLQQAIAAWGADGADVAKLESVQVQIGTLDDNLVGLTSGNEITIDPTADGWGWNTALSAPTPDQMDLLTVVEHELGHELGLPDVNSATNPNDLMAATLPVGVRRQPTT